MDDLRKLKHATKMFISIRNARGIVVLVTVAEFLKIEAAELARLMAMAHTDAAV